MTNPEFELGFDILYNNICSNQAPGLNQTEMSFFLNKAQVEVLKNHLNPKGNKYGEGYDDNSKRQIEFSSLVKDVTVYFTLENTNFAPATYTLPIVKRTNSSSDTVSDTVPDIPTDTPYNPSTPGQNGGSTDENETIDASVVDYDGNPVLDNDGNAVVTTIMNIILPTNNSSSQGSYAPVIPNPNGSTTSGNTQGTSTSNASQESNTISSDNVLCVLNENITCLSGTKANLAALYNYVRNVINSGNSFNGNCYTDGNIDLLKIYKFITIPNVSNNLAQRTLVVVPISFDEYDSHLAKPFSLPYKNQAWRLSFSDRWEIVLPTNVLPAKYHIRYVKMPTQIDLSDTSNKCELPEVLHQEVLQRAVELAKITWQGDLNAALTGGQRSE